MGQLVTIAKKQHFVPRFYLRQFVTRNDTIRVFDKFAQRTYSSNIKDVAVANYFYDLDQETIDAFDRRLLEQRAGGSIDQHVFETLRDELQNRQLIEQYLSDLEGQHKPVLDELLRKLKTRRRFDPRMRPKLAHMAALQLLRTLDERESRKELGQQIEKRLLPLAQRISQAHGGPEVTADQLGIAYDARQTEVGHSLSLLNRAQIQSVANILDRHIWFIGINDSGTPFYTSDNPVVRQAHDPNDFYGNGGIASPGIEIAYPLSPEYILIMIHPVTYAAALSWNNSIRITKSEQVKYYNSLQVRDSYRHVFSNGDNFELAHLMLERDPNLKIPRRHWFDPEESSAR